MSLFEVRCFNWYCENVNGFTREAGLIGDLFRDLKLRGHVRETFLRAMNQAHQAFENISAELARRRMERARSGV